jgi:hypothetical protein
MAWMNYALLLLLQQSEYADTYKPKIQALKPKFAKTMEFLLKQSSKDELRKANHGSPNRTLIIANAYAFGSLLLADVISPETKKAYLAEADFWIRNEFENDKLFRSFDGIFPEHGGYDTGYHGVALWMAIMHHLHFPNSIPNAEQKFAAASRWLENRILPNGVVDCTFNTRSGPNNAIGDAKNTDLLGVKRALFYSGALLGQSSAFDAAKRASQSINGLPPVFFSAETVRGKKGIPFQFDVLATNSGLKGNCSPKFEATASPVRRIGAA